MKYFLTALALVPSPALADGFQTREIVFQSLNAIDAVETCIALDKGARELNPILGSHPKCGEVVAFKIGSGVLHYVLMDFLKDRDPHIAKIAQIATIGLQGGVVAWNLKFVF